MNDKTNGRVQDLEQEAAGYFDEPVKAWKPSVGDTVAGVVKAIDVRTTEYSDGVPVLELETANGRVAVWALHSVLRSELKRLAAQVGDEIAIRRLEDAAKGYRRYKVFTPDGQVGAFTWDNVSVDGGDVAPDDQEVLLSGHSGGDDKPISEPDDLVY